MWRSIRHWNIASGGVSFTAAPWFASLWRLSPQPELMASAPLLSKIHILLAFAFAAYFPFTKLIHAWTLPVNYLVRPYQVLRTTAKKFQNGWVLGCWEFKGVTDKSYMTYLTAGVIGVLVFIAFVLPSPKGDGLVQTAEAAAEPKGPDSSQAQEVLEGYSLYVSQCARCHGLEGHGDGPGSRSPTFAAVPRNLTEGHFQFISTSNGVASSDDLRHAIAHGLTGSGMPGFGALSDRQIDSLVQTVEGFWKDRPTAGETIAVPARPEPTVAMIKEGKELYAGMCSVMSWSHGCRRRCASSAQNRRRGSPGGDTEPQERAAQGRIDRGAALLSHRGWSAEEQG
ncbi:MAG: c-type cytochrome [Rhodospirillales bacterium]|nr:c-type cytochrome [Rhodospirillales bacterium]